MATIKKDFVYTRSRKPDLTTLVYGKVPPQAPDLEEAIISASINSGRDAFEQILSIIPNEDRFYVDAHQKIYSALIRLFNGGYPIDLLTLIQELTKSNELEIVGGRFALMQISDKNVLESSIDHYCRIIIEKYLMRELIRISGGIISEAYDDSSDCFELIEKMGAENFNLLSENIQKIPSSVSEIANIVMQNIEERKISLTGITGIPTGFKYLNDKTNGWQNNDLTILAARPSIGKTAFAIQLALNAASYGFSTAIFSIEMCKNELLERMLANVGEVELSVIKNPNNPERKITDQESNRLIEAKHKISAYKIFIDDTSAITLLELRAKARRLKMKKGINMVIIDYLQLMSGTGNDGNREQEISKISRGLKALAKDLEVPVIALSQLNRGIEGKERDPQLSDLRESGAIEQDADNVLFLTNPTSGMIAGNKNYMGKKILTIAKGRNIGLGIVSLEFNSSTQRWKDPYESENRPTEQPYQPYKGFQRPINPNERIEPKQIDWNQQ